MKLYWKVKINGKWTFRTANIKNTRTDASGVWLIVEPYMGEIDDEIEMP